MIWLLTPPLHSPPVSKLDRRRHTGRRRKRDSLLTGKGEEEPNNTTAGALLIIQYLWFWGWALTGVAKGFV
jgi:hypothetical protein